MMKPRVLVLFAHPAFEKSRVNRRLVEAVRSLPGVTCHDLYECCPNFDVDVSQGRSTELDAAWDIAGLVDQDGENQDRKD